MIQKSGGGEGMNGGGGAAAPTKKKSRSSRDAAAIKRRCVSTACIACRRRKSKCDGNIPSCAACIGVYGTGEHSTQLHYIFREHETDLFPQSVFMTRIAIIGGKACTRRRSMV